MIQRKTIQTHCMNLSYLHADGPRLLLVHGSPNDATYWMDYLEKPVGGLEAIAVDRPGFGRSNPGTAE